MENEKQRKAPATKVHPDAIETIGAVRHDDSGVVPPSAAPFDERDGPLEYATVSTGHTVHVPTGERVMIRQHDRQVLL
jgi:hypothetical protein